MSRQTPHAVYTEALSLDEALNIIRTRNRRVTRPGDRGRREYQAARTSRRAITLSDRVIPGTGR